MRNLLREELFKSRKGVTTYICAGWCVFSLIVSLFTISNVDLPLHESWQDFQCRMPLFFDASLLSVIFAAVFAEITGHQRQLQTGDQEESDHQRQQHGIGNLHPEQVHEDEGQEHRKYHTEGKVEGDLLVVLTDGQVQHGIEDQYQADIAAKACKHIVHGNLPHEKFPEAEGNAKQQTEADVHQQPHIITGQNILVGLIVDHIRHILGQYRVKGRGGQKSENKNVKDRAGEQLSAIKPNA